MTNSKDTPDSKSSDLADTLRDATFSIIDLVADAANAQWNRRPNAPGDGITRLTKIGIEAAGKKTVSDTVGLVKRTLDGLFDDMRDSNGVAVDEVATTDTIPDVRKLAMEFIAHVAATSKDLLPTDGADGCNTILDFRDPAKRKVALAYLLLDPKVSGGFTKNLFKELRESEIWERPGLTPTQAYLDIIEMLRLNPSLVENDPAFVKQIVFKNSSPAIVAKLLSMDLLDEKVVWERFVNKNIPGTEAVPSHAVSKEAVLSTIIEKWPFVTDVLNAELLPLSTTRTSFDLTL